MIYSYEKILHTHTQYQASDGKRITHYLNMYVKFVEEGVCVAVYYLRSRTHSTSHTQNESSQLTSEVKSLCAF